MAPAYFRNMSGLLLAFVVLSALAHGISLMFSAEPIVQLAERRFGATIISTVLSPAKNQPAAQPSNKAAPLPQPKRSANEVQQLAQAIETTKQSTVSIISATRKTEFKVDPSTDSETKSETGPETTPEKRIETLRPHRTSEVPQQVEPIITTTTSINDIAPLTTEQLASQREKQRNYLLGELQSQLKRYLSYPVIARRRGWQGEVTVAFNVNTVGQLNNVRLAQSSGYSVLDRSAVNAINKLENISLPDTLGRLQAMELRLPVRYQLQES